MFTGCYVLVFIPSFSGHKPLAQSPWCTLCIIVSHY